MNHIARSLAVTATGLALAFGASVAATPASAATAHRQTHYVTHSQFKRIHKGMTLARVHQITGSWGRRGDFYPGGPGYPAQQERVYPTRGSSFADLTFARRGGVWVVNGKYAWW